MSYDSVALGIETSPGASPRGGQRVRESFYYTLVFPARSSHEHPRVNYGERVAASKGALIQEHVVYLPFRDIPALQYVYRQIDDEGEGGGDVGGSTLSPFRVVDKIRLTKTLVDTEFDCDALIERGLLEHHLCPHTFHTTDVDTSLDALRVQWGALLTPCSAIRGLLRRNYDAKTASDPLVHVRNYFGEQLALYFAFASFSAGALQALGILALLLAAVASKTSMRKELEATFCLCSCAFLAIFVRKWERREACLAARWSGGTPKDSDYGVNPLLQLPRPQFRGQMQRSPVTLRMEPYLPFWKGAVRYLASSLIFTVTSLERPFPAQALSVGAWLGYLQVLRIGAILHATTFMLMLLLDGTAADLDQRMFERYVVILGSLFAFVGWVAYVLKDPQDLAEERYLMTLKANQAALESKYLGHLGTHLAASAKTALPSGRVFLNGVPRYMVTGDKGEEDAAEELRDQWRQLQMHMLRLEKRVMELRGGDNGTMIVGVLYVEVQNVSLLPFASPVQAFVKLCVQSATVENAAGSSGDNPMGMKQLKDTKEVTKDSGRRTVSLSPSPGREANTSLSKKSRSPLWHESFELPVTALGDKLVLCVCDGGPMLGSVMHRRTLGRTQLGIDDIIVRTSSHASPLSTMVATTSADAAVKLKPTASAALSPLSLSSSSTDEEKETGEEVSSVKDSLRVAEMPMATYELPLELSESLRRTQQSELGKLGPPRLALRCGIQLHELGELLVQQRRLREKVAYLRSQEVQLARWGADCKSVSE
ncbi:hypothetical protein BBJ29_001974 [Phytophthora kernoviae]|uniref:C2 domain-containing protein n=1 Tax=Phytophthora kernoviae TaxID=325452 RepID=A0A421G7F4_9STRA|nr:hypothetical protein BBJ29_001974 [Phytophthora kernoviae]